MSEHGPQPMNEKQLQIALEDMLRRRLRSETAFGLFASSTIGDILTQYAQYELRREDFAACFGVDPRAELIRRGKMDRVALGELVKLPASEAAPRCGAPGCDRPATRTIAGNPCCDNEAHRTEPLSAGRRH